MTGLTTAESIFLENALGGVFYGIYCVLFVQYLNLLNKSVRKPLTVYPLSALFILGTAFVAIGFAQGFFYLVRPTAPGTALTLFHLRLCTSIIYSFLDLISQGVLIHRCWIVWGKKITLVIIPSVLSLTSFVMDIVLVVGLSYFGPTPRNRPDWYTQLGTTSFSISLATNTIVTAILILRLVMVHREVHKIVVGRKHYLVEIVAMLIESGALTFISQLIWVVLFSLQNISTGFDAIAAVTALSCGIAPTAVIVRVAMGRSYETRLTDATESTIHFPVQKKSVTITTSIVAQTLPISVGQSTEILDGGTP